MPKEIASCNHDSLSFSEKEFEADVKFQKSNLPIIFNERHRLIHENFKTTISWGWGQKGKSDDYANKPSKRKLRYMERSCKYHFAKITVFSEHICNQGLSHCRYRYPISYKNAKKRKSATPILPHDKLIGCFPGSPIMGRMKSQGSVNFFSSRNCERPTTISVCPFCGWFQ
jgi:hypothetical protein